MTLNELASDIAAQFNKKYNRSPRWIVAAPGRVNVIGEHTDYNDGFVLPMAINRYTLLAADFAKSSSSSISIYDSRADIGAQIDISSRVAKGEPAWSNYLRGVMAGFQGRGVKLPALDVVLHSTVPLGAGLSSSAALEVSTATLLEAATGTKMDPIEKALLCQTAEHEFPGVPCGIMDQFISVMGRENHLLLLDCRSHETQLVPMSDPGIEILIINSNVRHELTGGEYAVRRAQCETAAKILGVKSLRDATADAAENARSSMDDVVFRRTRHIVSEIERTVHAAEAFRASNWITAGQLMYASHYSMRDDYEISCPELDIIVEIAESIGMKGGIFGCRMTGGGFGGCAVALVKTDAVSGISNLIAKEYKGKTGIEATMFTSRPAGGAATLLTP
ncbi:MAG: galactokinase [Limisphaerales bacterium]